MPLKRPTTDFLRKIRRTPDLENARDLGRLQGDLKQAVEAVRDLEDNRAVLERDLKSVQGEMREIATEKTKLSRDLTTARKELDQTTRRFDGLEKSLFDRDTAVIRRDAEIKALRAEIDRLNGLVAKKVAKRKTVSADRVVQNFAGELDRAQKSGALGAFELGDVEVDIQGGLAAAEDGSVALSVDDEDAAGERQNARVRFTLKRRVRAKPID